MIGDSCSARSAFQCSLSAGAQHLGLEPIFGVGGDGRGPKKGGETFCSPSMMSEEDVLRKHSKVASFSPKIPSCSPNKVQSEPLFFFWCPPLFFVKRFSSFSVLFSVWSARAHPSACAYAKKKGGGGGNRGSRNRRSLPQFSAERGSDNSGVVFVPSP